MKDYAFVSHISSTGVQDYLDTILCYFLSSIFINYTRKDDPTTFNTKYTISNFYCALLVIQISTIGFCNVKTTKFNLQSKDFEFHVRLYLLAD